MSDKPNSSVTLFFILNPIITRWCPPVITRWLLSPPAWTSLGLSRADPKLPCLPSTGGSKAEELLALVVVLPHHISERQVLFFFLTKVSFFFWGKEENEGKIESSFIKAWSFVTVNAIFPSNGYHERTHLPGVVPFIGDNYSINYYYLA